MPFRYDVVHQNANSLPADRYMNSFNFNGGSGDSAALAAIAIPALVAFFNTGVGGNPPLAAYLGQQASRTTNASRVTWYDLTETEPRTPHSSTFTLGPAATGTAGGTPLPAEVACVASLTSDHLGPTGRGRIYLGPFNTSAVEAGNESGESRPAIGLRVAIRDACIRLANAMHAGGGTYDWLIVSQVDSANYPITHGYIDNAWDTQRRRGLAASSRVTWLRGA
jgi:hypothetical protein